MTRRAETPHCAHDGARWGSCPRDYLCQIRLRGSGPYGEQWQTVTSIACDSSPATWQAQVAPHKRRQGYETRVIRAGDE